MRQNKRYVYAGFFALIIALAVSACSSSSGGSTHASSAVAAGSAGAATSASPNCTSYTTFPVGTTHTLSDAPVIVADNLGYFARYCIKVQYVPELLSADQIATLASSQIWAIGIGWVPAMYTAAAQGIDFKVVADKAGLNSDHGAYGVVIAKQYAAPKADACQSLKAAEGKGFGVASTTDLEINLMNGFLKQCGLTTSNFKMTILPFAAQAAALDSGAIAISYQAEPNLTPLVQTGKAVYLEPNVGGGLGSGSISVGPLVFGPYLENPAHKQLAQNIINAYTLGIRGWEDAVIKGTNKTAILNMVAAGTNTAPDLLAQMHLPYFDPNDFTVPSVYSQVSDFAKNLEDYYVAQGEIKQSQSIPVAQMFDLSFAQNTVKQFGVWSGS